MGQYQDYPVCLAWKTMALHLAIATAEQSIIKAGQCGWFTRPPRPHPPSTTIWARPSFPPQHHSYINDVKTNDAEALNKNKKRRMQKKSGIFEVRFEKRPAWKDWKLGLRPISAALIQAMEYCAMTMNVNTHNVWLLIIKGRQR